MRNGKTANCRQVKNYGVWNGRHKTNCQQWGKLPGLETPYIQSKNLDVPGQERLVRGSHPCARSPPVAFFEGDPAYPRQRGLRGEATALG